MQTVALKKWHSQTICRVAELYSSTAILSLTLRKTYYSIPWCENHPQTNNILQFFIIKKDGKSTLYKAKHGVCQIL